MCTPWLCSSKIRETAIPATRTTKAPGILGKPAIDGEQHGERGQPGCHGPKIGFAGVAQGVPQLLIGVPLARHDAQQFRQLLDDDAEGNAEHKSLQHRLGDEVGNETELQNAGQQEQQRRATSVTAEASTMNLPGSAAASGATVAARMADEAEVGDTTNWRLDPKMA